MTVLDRIWIDIFKSNISSLDVSTLRQLLQKLSNNLKDWKDGRESCVDRVVILDSDNIGVELLLDDLPVKEQELKFCGDWIVSILCWIIRDLLNFVFNLLFFSHYFCFLLFPYPLLCLYDNFHLLYQQSWVNWCWKIMTDISYNMIVGVLFLMVEMDDFAQTCFSFFLFLSFLFSFSIFSLSVMHLFLSLCFIFHWLFFSLAYLY